MGKCMMSRFDIGKEKAHIEIKNSYPKFCNAPGKKVSSYKGYAIQDYGGSKFVVFTSDGDGYAQTTKDSIEEAKKWIDGHKHPSSYIGSQHSEPFK